jgi:phage terminase large subunit-like protein
VGVAAPARKPVRRRAAPPRRPSDGVHAYARAVDAGRIVAGPYVRAAARRHLADLDAGARRGLRFDAGLADHALRFFDYLRLAEGEFAGRPFTLAPAQVFVVGSLFGWVGSDGYRRFRLAYIEMGKGNGKSPLLSGVGLYCLLADEEQGAEVYAAAVTREQAGIMFRDAKRMAEASPSLRSRLEISEHNIAHPASGSFFRPVSSEGRSLDGKRVHAGLIDEIHEHPSSVVVDKIRAGTKGRRQALICEITNSGYDRHSVCWQHHDYSIKVATGAIENDAWFGYVCALDEGDEWTDEAVWPKANPLLDVSITRKYLREQIAEAQGIPAKGDIVKRLSFCVWTEGVARWLPLEGWDAMADGRMIPPGTAAFAGLDLASTTDLTAFTLVAPRDHCDEAGHAGRCIDLRALFWAPEAGARRRAERDRVPYLQWAQEGWITLTPGDITDYRAVRAGIHDIAERVVLRAIGYDRWNAAQIVTELGDDGFFMIPVGQGYASLATPSREIETFVIGGLVHHDGNPVLRWMVGNVNAETDPAGNLKPSREKSTDRIDGIAAWCDALFARHVAGEPRDEVSAYETVRTILT